MSGEYPTAGNGVSGSTVGTPRSGFVSYLLCSIREGFREGIYAGTRWLQSSTFNMGSALQNSHVVSEYLSKERQAGHVLGLVEGPLRDSVHLNRFGVIPKPHQPGKWCLIVDLSHPHGASVNEGVDGVLCFLTYASVDDAVELIVEAGRGAILAKLNMQSACRIIPVHLEDRPLLGMK